MRQEQRRSGIMIEVPDGYEAPSATTRSRARQQEIEDFESIPHYAEVDAAVLQALEAEDLALIDTFEFESDPKQRRLPRTRSPQEQVIRVALEPDPGETAIALVEQDGVYSWQFPRPGRRGTEERTLVFDIPLSDAAPGGTRSALSAGTEMVGRVRGRLLKAVTGLALDYLEKDVSRGLVGMRPGGPEEWVHLDTQELDLPTDRDPRILLFVHGTFSSTLGSFNALGSLAAGDELLADMAKRYDAVVGFDHPTLSLDPAQNARELLDLLEEASPRPLTLDAVSYSRGGLVLRSFGSLLSQTPITLERAVFVGATNEGTALAEPDNWHDFIDLYTNLVLGAARAIALIPGAAPATAVVGGVIKGISVAVKYLVDHSVDPDAVPGLAAMEPDGDFVRDLAKTLAAQSESESVENYAVLSDFEPSADSGGLANELPRKLLMRVADPVVDRLMQHRPNDLVVDTPSMTAITGSRGQEVVETLNFDTNSVVYHTVYFTQNRLGESLRDWFELGAGSSRRVRSGARQAEEVFRQIDANVVPGSAVVAEKPVPVKREDEERHELRVEVMWDSIVEATGNVYAVGHYRGVVPQRAELALDTIVSDSKEDDHLVLTGLTRNNLLTARLGEISFFPWGGSDKRNRLIAVCGMGDYAAFGTQRLRRVYRSLAQSVAALPDERTVCMVLIGAGEGAIPVEDAVTQLVLGFGDAIRSTGRGSRIRRIRIIEMVKGRAEQIQRAFERLSNSEGIPVDLDLPTTVRAGKYGIVTDAQARSLLVRAAYHKPGAVMFADIVDQLDESVQPAIWGRPTDAEGFVTEESPLRRQLRETWEKVNGDIDELAKVTQQWVGTDSASQRITFVRSGDRYLASAITDDATVPEREILVQPSLIKEAIVKMTYPKPDDMEELSKLLFRLALPRDFREMMSADGPLIVEVDRQTAPIHWEMLASGLEEADYEPIGLRRPVARQLRTQYSENFALNSGRKRQVNVLVIGDPGDPDKGEDLPKARKEARHVAAYLRGLASQEAKIRVEELIGAPNNLEPNVAPATRLEVLRKLMGGGIDLVHYAGHGNFDPDKPQDTGWLFYDGMLTSGEIERVDVPPAVVVANACLTGQVSTRVKGQTTDEASHEAGLLPSLADEFFNRGVQNYIGTAWEIDDAGAVEFATAFYQALFTPSMGRCATIGDALLTARRKVYEWEQEESRKLVLWPAYQHYGDPGFRFSYQSGSE